MRIISQSVHITHGFFVCSGLLCDASGLLIMNLIFRRPPLLLLARHLTGSGFVLLPSGHFYNEGEKQKKKKYNSSSVRDFSCIKYPLN